MNWDLILLLMFFLIVYIFYLTNKKKFDVQGKIFFLYRTRFGLKLMDKMSMFCPRLLKVIGITGIIVGFIGMITMLVLLIQTTIKLVIQPAAQPGLVPVLPGIKVSPLLPVLSFMHWIIIIFIVALVHEFSHGIFARLNRIKIKSSGFAFLGPIPAAFVEPDEKQMEKKSRKAQLSILSAGPFSNIVLAFVVLLLMLLIFMPIQQSLTENSGIIIISTISNYPANISGVQPGSIVYGVNSYEVKSSDEFLEFIKNNEDEFVLNTDRGDYTINPIREDGNNLIGIQATQIRDYKNKNLGTSFFGWFIELLRWLWIISFGVGLFNLLPLGPVDGGKMLMVGLSYFTKDENKIKTFWKYISFFVLGLIVINLLPYLVKLIMWIFSFII
ncbi:site-2 protease family protein [Candidatus Woesearchaeota archaeon]|nr:site-2 protease family protein [Candidatus Woesearchaeota archaeon]